jgi:hypothetical protein
MVLFWLWLTGRIVICTASMLSRLFPSRFAIAGAIVGQGCWASAHQSAPTTQAVSRASALWGLLWGLSISLGITQYRCTTPDEVLKSLCRKPLVALERYRAIPEKSCFQLLTVKSLVRIRPRGAIQKLQVNKTPHPVPSRNMIRASGSADRVLRRHNGYKYQQYQLELE